jgi:hypothetical protein
MSNIDKGLSSPQKRMPSRTREVVDMWEAGMQDLSVVAEEVGLTRGQVAQMLRRSGYDIYAGHLTLIDRYTDEELEEMLGDYYDRDMRIWELTHKWELGDVSSFYNILRMLGKQPKSRTDSGKKEARWLAIEHACKLYDENLDMTIAEIHLETGVDPARLNIEVRKRGIILRSKRQGYTRAK